MVKCPPITNKFTLPWKTLQLLLTGMLDIYANLFASSRTNAIQRDNRQDNSTYYTLLWPNNHISVLLIPDWSFRSRWTQKGDLKLRPQSSQICPLKGPYSWMVDWMSIRGIYYCLYEVHWLGSMVFHWYDTHLLKLLHAIWSPSTLKIGEVETKGVKKHICKRRPREEEAECPHNRYNEVKMWMHQALLGWVQGCESCGWKTLR